LIKRDMTTSPSPEELSSEDEYFPVVHKGLQPHRDSTHRAIDSSWRERAPRVVT
jgi:hypothetical protein